LANFWKKLLKLKFIFDIEELAKDYLNRKPNHKVVGGIISPVSDLYGSLANKKLEPSVHRCEMVRRSLIPLNNIDHWVKMDDWESQQTEWFRTVQVLDHHYNQLNDRAGNQSHINLKLLCGADLFETFNVPNLWKDEDIEKIVGKYGLVVISRKGYDPWATLENSDKSSILKKYKVCHI